MSQDRSHDHAQEKPGIDNGWVIEFDSTAVDLLCTCQWSTGCWLLSFKPSAKTARGHVIQLCCVNSLKLFGVSELVEKENPEVWSSWTQNSPL